MAACVKCGVEVDEGVELCQECDNVVSEAEVQEAAPAVEAAPAPAPAAPDKDAQDGKTMGILAYILFFIPLLTGDYKKSPFVKFHTNQGTVLWIIWVGYLIVGGILRSVIKVPRYYFGLYGSYTPGWLIAILNLGSLAICVLAILGIINAAKGEKKPLPIIGDINIIK